jgi:DNA mismatch endonuclease (patch repair protein)
VVDDDNVATAGRAIPDQFPTNTDFWVAKIRGNMRRDQEVTAALRTAGWRVLRVWESKILADPVAAADEVERVARGE